MGKWSLPLLAEAPFLPALRRDVRWVDGDGITCIIHSHFPELFVSKTKTTSRRNALPLRQSEPRTAMLRTGAPIRPHDPYPQKRWISHATQAATIYKTCGHGIIFSSPIRPSADLRASTSCAVI